MQPSRTLLDKWRLVRAAARDNKRLSAGDVSVLMALCDRYGSKTRPDAPPIAGHALLASMAGMSRRATIDSTRRLIDAGYIAVQELGKGTKGTTYSLNFARGEADFTTKGNDASGEPQFTTVVKPSSPLGGSSGEAYFTESPLTEAPLQGGLRERGNDCPAATPPDAGGFAAAAPGTGQEDGFNELWKAYGVRRGFKDAQTEFDKVAPVDHADILAAATAWRDGWAGTGKPHSERMGLAKWLKDSQWRNDPPKVFKPKERKPRQSKLVPPPTPVSAPANDNTPLNRVPARIEPNFYSGWVSGSDVDLERRVLKLQVRVENHFAEVADQFPIHLEMDGEGQRLTYELMEAVGVSEMEDSDELHHVPFHLEVQPDHSVRFTTIAAANAA